MKGIITLLNVAPKVDVIVGFFSLLLFDVHSKEQTHRRTEKTHLCVCCSV